MTADGMQEGPQEGQRGVFHELVLWAVRKGDMQAYAIDAVMMVTAFHTAHSHGRVLVTLHPKWPPFSLL